MPDLRPPVRLVQPQRPAAAEPAAAPATDTSVGAILKVGNAVVEGINLILDELGGIRRQLALLAGASMSGAFVDTTTIITLPVVSDALEATEIVAESDQPLFIHVVAFGGSGIGNVMIFDHCAPKVPDAGANVRAIDVLTHRSSANYILMPGKQLFAIQDDDGGAGSIAVTRTPLDEILEVTRRQ